MSAKRSAASHGVVSGSGLALFLPHLDVLAHTGRCLLVAKELESRGCRVVFAGAGKYKTLVAEAGFETHELPEMPVADIVTESKRGKRWPFHSPSQISPLFSAELALYDALAPDTIVFDHRYTAGISAEAAGIPRVSVTNLWWTPYDAVGMGLAETHPLFAVAPWLRFTRRIPGADALGNALAAAMFRRWIKPYNVVRNAAGMPPLASILDLFTADAVILPDTPELTPSVPGLPDSFHYVGPLVWEPSGDLPDELSTGEPFVYVTMGSSADPAVFDTIVEALRELDDIRAVVTTGGVRSPGEFAGAPERISFYEFLPGSGVAARSRLVVCQGGIGTIYQALSQGKPLVGVPFMPEQEVYGIGAVERRGAGVTVSPVALTPARLAEAIDRVLCDESFSRAAQRLADSIDLTSGPRKAADVIEGVMG